MPHLLAVDGGREPVPSRAEVLRHRTIGGQEALGMPWGFNALHASFPLARRLVGVCGTEVTPQLYVYLLCQRLLQPRQHLR